MYKIFSPIYTDVSYMPRKISLKLAHNSTLLFMAHYFDASNYNILCSRFIIKLAVKLNGFRLELVLSNTLVNIAIVINLQTSLVS